MTGPVMSRSRATVFKGTISPAAVADLQLAHLLGRAAERAVGLELDLPGAAELVEVVDVQRAHVDLQRVEDVADAHAHRLDLDAVDVGVQLRRVRAEQGEQARPGRAGGWPRSISVSVACCSVCQAERRRGPRP